MALHHMGANDTFSGIYENTLLLVGLLNFRGIYEKIHYCIKLNFWKLSQK